MYFVAIFYIRNSVSYRVYPLLTKAIYEMSVTIEATVEEVNMSSIFVYKQVYKSSHEFRIVPVGKVLNEYRTDYLGLLKVGRKLKTLVSYELKQSVACHITSLNPSHLAQTIVQGYYALLGASQDVVLALTDIGTTHYFKLKIPSTRAANNMVPRHLELEWYKKIVLPQYPPSKKYTFECLHYTITELV